MNIKYFHIISLNDINMYSMKVNDDIILSLGLIISLRQGFPNYCRLKPHPLYTVDRSHTHSI